MGVLPAEDLANLNPSSTREWLQHLNRRFDVLEESIAEDRDTYLNIFNELKLTNKNQDARLEKLEVCTGQQTEAIDTLKKSSRVIDGVTGIGTFIAMILAALGLKGS